jgi:hypothetical protein
METRKGRREEIRNFFRGPVLAHESQMVFEDIRRKFVHEYEWSDMPTEGLTKDQQSRRHSTWAIINRFSRHIGFFDRVLALQPKFMAVFGKQTEETFQKLHRARNHIRGACDILIEIADPVPGTDEWSLTSQMRSDIFDINNAAVKELNRVTNLLAEFRADIERICAPLISHEFNG